MDGDAFRLMASHEDRHWWFVGRRAVIGAVLDVVSLPPSPAILEAGCGTGGNLYLLAQRGDVSAFEPSFEARAILAARDPERIVADGELPSRIPFEPGAFDLVVALDVLEHVEEDGEALAALVDLASPGGAILVTVPAHAVLWGSHDLRLSHRRRYGRRQLVALASGLPADIEFLSAFNMLLAPLAVTLRLAERVTTADLGNQERMPPGWINRLLAAVFSAERWLVRRRALPAGLSYAMVLRRHGS